MTVADPGFPGECQPQASPNLLFCKIFTENCMKKRMHSSRMHTTRSLTVSRSIGVEGCCGGLPNLPWMQTPCMQIPQEADPPGCRRPLRQIPWMQTPGGRPPLNVWRLRVETKPVSSSIKWVSLGTTPYY